jgi:hypothetical protein
VSGLKAFFQSFHYLPTSTSQKWELFAREISSIESPSERESLFKLLAVTPSDFTGKFLFGSVAEYLDAVGLFEGKATPYGGYRSIASDRHVCLSIGERTICEYLSSIEVPHEKEPSYPADQALNPNGKYRADFRVGEWLIEYAGRMGVPEYAARMSDKKKLAKVNGLNLLVLEPKDLVELPAKMKQALAQFKNGQPSVS